MAFTKRLVLLSVVVFVAGMVAGSGVGIVYGQRANQVTMEQKVSDLEKQLSTVNNNYLILVREYNKLLTVVNLPPAAGAVTQTSTGPTKAATPAPAKPPASAPAEATLATQAAPAGAQTTPTANFSSDPVQGPPGTDIRFKDESTGTITSWLWDFGDGTTSTERNPVHTYKGDPNKAYFTVTLTVTGPGGSDTIQKKDYIWISEACGC